MSESDRHEIVARMRELGLFGAGRRLIELSKRLHPADRFRHTMTLRREGA